MVFCLHSFFPHQNFPSFFSSTSSDALRVHTHPVRMHNWTTLRCFFLQLSSIVIVTHSHEKYRIKLNKYWWCSAEVFALLFCCDAAGSRQQNEWLSHCLRLFQSILLFYASVFLLGHENNVIYTYRLGINSRSQFALLSARCCCHRYSQLIRIVAGNLLKKQV